MDAISSGKELAETEPKSITAQTPKEELLKAISNAKLPRIRRDYEECLLGLAKKHFEITREEFESLDENKKKTLETYMLEKMRAGWRKESGAATSYFVGSAVGVVASIALAYCFDSIFLFGLFSLLFIMAGFSLTEESKNKKFLDAYHEFHGGAENE